MERGRSYAIAAVLVVATPVPDAEAGVRGEYGWSADGLAYGTCEPWILPDSPDGCRFFHRPTRRWIELGRREALAQWRPWDEPVRPAGLEPIIAVYPMDQPEDDPGPVTLSGRLVPSDHVVELWSLEGDVPHGARGGEWKTVFDYSPDGTWLAVGAVHVDHDTSLNEFHVVVRPLPEWLALAHVRLAREELARGRIRDGLSHLADARAYLEGRRGWEPEGVEPEGRDSPLDAANVQLDALHRRTFLRWSNDGRTLCACEAFQDETGRTRSRCRTTGPAEPTWSPVMVSLVHTRCPGAGPPPAERPSTPYRFWADGGYDGERAGVAVYMTGGALGTRIGAVMERSWKEPVSRAVGYPSYFHAVGLPSPDGRYLAVGFLEEPASEPAEMRYEVEIARPSHWVEIARADIALYERSDPVTLEDATPVLELPHDGVADGAGPEADGGADEGGCSARPR